LERCWWEFRQVHIQFLYNIIRNCVFHIFACIEVLFKVQFCITNFNFHHPVSSLIKNFLLSDASPFCVIINLQTRPSFDLKTDDDKHTKILYTHLIIEISNGNWNEKSMDKVISWHAMWNFFYFSFFCFVYVSCFYSTFGRF
jgi:hypothetical protein